MDHAKKMLLVDPARLNSQHADLREPSGDLLKQLYRPTIVDKQLSRLDADIAKTLNSDLPDDVKAKQYEMALRGYRYYEPKSHHPQRPLRWLKLQNSNEKWISFNLAPFIYNVKLNGY